MLRKTPNYALLEHIFFNFHNILLAASLQNSFFPKTICAAQRDAVCEGVTKVANFYLCRSTRSTSSKALTWCILWWFRSWRCLIDYVVVQQKGKTCWSGEREVMPGGTLLPTAGLQEGRGKGGKKRIRTSLRKWLQKIEEYLNTSMLRLSLWWWRTE